MNNAFKVLSLIFALLFLTAAVLQYNDPDALLWYALYGLAALISVLFFFGRASYLIVAVLCVGYLVGAFVAWPSTYEGVTIGSGDIVNIEKGREALGLFIVSGVMLIYALRIRYGGNLKV